MKTTMLIAAGIILLSGALLHAQSVTGYRYALVQFAIDSPELTPMNERVIRDFIAPDIGKDATVSVTGYTDVVGLETRNADLSRQRAENVAKVIRKVVPKKRKIQVSVRGVGEDYPLYDNLLPEGRFFNRTVIVTIGDDPE